MCEGCRTGHEKLVIFLPQVRPEVLEIALLQFYLKGDAEKLKDILDVTNVNTQAVKKETLADTEIYESNIDHEQNNSVGNIIEEMNTNEKHIKNEDSENNTKYMDTENCTGDKDSVSEKEEDDGNPYNIEEEVVELDVGNTSDLTGHDKETKMNIKLLPTAHTENALLPLKLIRCNIDNCDKGFSTTFGLNKHRKNIHGVGNIEQKFECPICGKMLLYLNEHMKALHKEDQETRGTMVCEVCRQRVDNMKKHRGVCISCPLCEYKNNKKSRLLKHIYTFHGQNGDEQIEPMDLTL